MSNLGFQAVYRLFSEQPRFRVERAFLPEKDNQKITSFESRKPLSSAELLAVSVSFETDYPYVLRLLESAGLNLSARREETGGRFQLPERRFRPFILGGGAAVTLNPEPLANFFDALVIGEGEEVIGEFCEVYLQARQAGSSHQELLEELSRLEGVYVPGFHHCSYLPNGEIAAIQPKSGIVRPKRRYVKDLDSFATTTVVQTPDTEFKSMFMTETGRGCEVGCKFCVAGYMYRPIRKRSAEQIAESVKRGVACSDSIGFVGAAVSSHPEIAALASSVAKQGKRAALSSIMTQRVSKELAASLSESEYKTVALAPETGDEELRFRIGKRVRNEQILEGIEKLSSEGIRNFKLYFMVGLPSEEVPAVEAIPALVALAQERALAAAKASSRGIAPKLILSVNPFIPKAWTPFQRHGLMGFADLQKRLKIVREGVRRLPNVEMKHESPRESYFQAVLSRGDRRVGDLLLMMHQEGRDWRWLVKHGAERVLEHVPPADFYARRMIAADQLLPWEAVDLRIKRSLLERQYERTFQESVKPIIERSRRIEQAAKAEEAGGKECQA